MPRKPAQNSVADEHAAPGGAAAVDRAISLLHAFGPGDQALSVTELAQRTRLYKSTVLRLAASLAQGRLLRKTADGLWALGPEVARLNAIFAASFSLEAVALPIMRRLMQQTQESVSLHVRQGDQRICLLRVDSPQLLRDHIRAGDVLPLDRGSGGRVLLAFSGEPGALYDKIRHDGYLVMAGDRVPGLAGMSAPVWGLGGLGKRDRVGAPELIGALTLTFPEGRMQAGFLPALLEAVVQLSEVLGG